MRIPERSKVFLFVALILFGGIFWSSTPIYAAAFDIGCSTPDLIAAVTTANSNAQSDTINLTGGCTYTLSSRLAINADGGNQLTINGNGAILTVSGARGIMGIAFGANAVINSLTFRDGNADNFAGADSDFAGAIMNTGTLTVNGSYFLNNHSVNLGGAIFNQGTLNVNGSTFSGNSSFYGGAIEGQGGPITIINSTFTGNSVSGGGSGGGAIDNTGDLLTIINSTFSGNSGLAADVLFNGNGGSLLNSILASSGACMKPTGLAITVTNSYVNGGTCGVSNGVNGNLTSGTLNLGSLTGFPPYFIPGSGSVAINAGSIALIPGGVTTDQRGNPRNLGGSPDMGSIETGAVLPTITFSGGGIISEGGSTTFTVSRSGATTASILVNLTITPTGITTPTDYTLSGGSISGQTGSVTVLIPAGSSFTTLTFNALDDGASAEPLESLAVAVAANAAVYQLGGSTSATADISANGLVVTQSGDAGEGSLRQAILNANSDGVDSTITFSGVSTVTLTTAELTLANNGALTMNGGAGVTVQRDSGASAFRIFTVLPNANVTINTVTITNGSASGGGGIYNEGTLTVNNSTVSGNSAADGGGIYNAGTLTLNNSIVSSNSATAIGGGILNFVGTLTLNNSTVSGNSAVGGGGIYNNDTLINSTLYLYNSIVANSTSGGDCGGAGTITAQYSLIEDGSCVNGLSATPDANGNISGDPMLDAGFMPQTGSPVIDRGNPASPLGAPPACLATDFNGTARPLGARCDMGAFESPFNAPVVTISAFDNTGAESGADTITFRITRTGSTTAALTVSYTIGGTAAAGDYTPTLTGSVDIPASSAFVDVTLTPVDDQFDEASESVTLILTDTADYDLGVDTSATATISDDDTAGYDVDTSATAASIAEPGEFTTLTIRLTSQPIGTGEVDLNFNSIDFTQCTVSPASFTFDASNWNIAQTITITAIDDLGADGTQPCGVGIQQIGATSTAAEYIGVPNPVIDVNVTDDDTAGYDVDTSATAANIAEPNAFTTLTIRLTSQPIGAGEVDLNFTSLDTTECTVSPASFTFDASNWNIAQTIIITAVDDLIADGTQACGVGIQQIGATSTAAEYIAVPNPVVNLNVTDNEIAGITVNAFSLISVPEDDTTITTSFTIAANTPPLADVTIALTTDGQCAVSPTTVTLPTGVTTPQTVTVSAVNDSTVEAVSHLCVITTGDPASADTNYNAITAADVSVTVLDNDLVFAVTTSGAIAEGTGSNPTVTFTITPGAAIANVGGSVTYTLTDTSATTTDADFTAPLSGGTLNFAAGSGAQTVEIIVTGDAITEPNFTLRFDSSASTAGTNGTSSVSGIPADVTITDDDSPGIVITQSNGSSDVTEGGATDSLTAALLSQPTSDVTIAITVDTQVNASGVLPLVFTSANWNTPQTVTLTAVDDSFAEGAHTGSITFAVTSADTVYNGTAIPPVSVNITDNDIAGIAVNPPVFELSEGLGSAYQIRLLTQPTSAPITLLVEFDTTQLTVNGSSAPFFITLSDTTPQTIPFSVLGTLDINSTRDLTITHTVIGSTAPEYPIGMAQIVSLRVVDFPPPPPSPTCDSENANPDGVIRTGIPDALAYAINCRVLYYNGVPTSWLGNPLYSEANLGIAGLLNLGVQQAVDIFSPPPSNLSYFEGGFVMCLRGEGTLIWLAASGSPRVPQIIGSYTVPEFSGFTCTSLFEPGTLILVSDNPTD